MEWLYQNEKLLVSKLRKKNSRIMSSYLHMCDSNTYRSKSMITFTSPQPFIQDKLTHIKEVKRQFSKSLRNLKTDIDKFFVIELGKNLDNPHLHVQLFHNEKDINRIKKVFLKILDQFNLHEKHCAFTETNSKERRMKYFLYPLKEYSKKLTDKEVLLLHKARQELRAGSNKNMQFISRSNGLLTHKLYKVLYYDHGLDYMTADILFREHLISINKHNPSKIIWTIKPILEVLMFTISSIFSTYKIRQKFLYKNKKKDINIFKKIGVKSNVMVGFT